MKKRLSSHINTYMLSVYQICVFFFANQMARNVTLPSHLECDTVVHEIGISPFPKTGPSTMLFVTHMSRKMRPQSRNTKVLATNSARTRNLLVMVIICTIGEKYRSSPRQGWWQMLFLAEITPVNVGVLDGLLLDLIK